MIRFRSDVAFTDSVKAEQAKRGSRDAYRKRIEKRDWHDTITGDLAAFIAQRNSFYFATATTDGQPYIQHRGGPRGFLQVIDDRTLGFADFSGNRQYVSLGNLAENAKAYIFLMDYASRQRIKIWGTARIIEDDPALIARLMVPGYDARPERAILFEIAAWDINCPQHIPQKYDLEDVEKATAALSARIAELEAELAQLKAQSPAAV